MMKLQRRRLQFANYFTIFFFTVFFTPSVLEAQTCCVNEVYPNNGLETTATLNSMFPNSTITTANNATSITNSFSTNNFTGIGGWFLGTSQTTSTDAFLIRDATRASEGSQFWYLPKPVTNTNAGNSICLQNATTLTSDLTCNTYNVKEGKRYVACTDFAPFDIASPNGGVGISQPVFEYATVTPTVMYDRLYFYDSTGVIIPNATSVSWTNVATSWKKGWLTFTGKAGYEYVAFSTLESATAGGLFDNMSLQEIRVIASGIGTVTCSPTYLGREFTLNPESNVGGIPNLKYTVTAPTGYTVTPATGIYGQTTTFILDKISGNANGTGIVIITIADEINTECTVTESIPDVTPLCAPCVTPTITGVLADTATCNNGVTNSDAAIHITGITNMGRYAYNTDGSTLYAMNATASTASSIDLIGLANPSVPTTYTFRIWPSDTTCYNDTTVVLNPSVCPPGIIDLVLSKTVDSASVSATGRQVTFTMTVKNVSTANATGVKVKVTPTVGFTFVSATPSVSYDNPTGMWTVGAVNAGDSAILQLTVTADSIGVNYCTAEIFAADQTDSNSIPNNNVATEDDIARACVSVPMPICPNQSYNAILPNGLTGIQWYKNGVALSGETNQTLNITTIGDYTFTANESTCPVQGCCPIKVVTGICPVICKPVICLTVGVVRQ